MKKFGPRRWPKAAKRRRKTIPSRSQNRGKRAFVAVIFLLIFGLCALVVVDKQIAPILNIIAKQKIHMEITKVMQEAVNEEMKANPQYANYQELVYMEKDANGNVMLLVPNTMKLNLLISDIVLNIEDKIQKMQAKNLSIPLGAVTGNKILSSLGPNISIHIRPITNISSRIQDDFVSQGINQTHHRIWLNLESTFSVAVPFDSEKITVSESVLLCESIIVGPIPETYFNLNATLPGL